jgi:glycerol dehydrogenase-like iron-containing ADH family enzyme
VDGQASGAGKEAFPENLRVDVDLVRRAPERWTAAGYDHGEQ